MPNSIPAPNVAAAWTDIAAHRRRDALTILPLSLLAAGGSVVWLGPVFPALWLGGTLILLLISHLIGRWVESLRGSRGWPARWAEPAVAAFTFLYTLGYCALPLALLLQANPTGIIAGSCMLGVVSISRTAEVVISRPIGLASLAGLTLVAVLAVLGLEPTMSPLQSVVAGLAIFCFETYVVRHAFKQAATQRLLVASVETARSKEAEAAAANEAKTVFLATMSHEIRTPLNGVLGMAQAMDKGDLSAAQRDRLTIIRQSGEALTAILNDVLDLSKIEAGLLVLETVAFDLTRLLTDSSSAFSMLARDKGLTLDLEIAPAAGGPCLGDPTRLRQVLYNLISNAVKFTDRGGVSIRADRDAAGALVLSVSDTGGGIRADQMERLFTKFTQLDASTTRMHGGTGLGLAICRRLCLLMGGDVTVQSNPGEGSTFTIIAPFPVASWEDVQPPERSPAVPEPENGDEVVSVRAPRILAAEDNATNQHVLRALLGHAGIVPTIVDNGAQAVEAWSQGEWDLILMDIHMPVMDGVAALTEIRRRESVEGRARTPIVALTANAMRHQVKSLLAAGMDGHVSKPIEVAALFAAIEGAVAHTPVPASVRGAGL